jgi:hypothetical protein
VSTAVTLGLAGCSSQPTAPAKDGSPAPFAATAEARPLLTASGSEVRAQDKPNAVFLTTPRADGDRVIRGTFPFNVQFNNCQTRPGNEDDNLKFTYDFDDDGTVDAFGYCRWDHVYEGNSSARVCVSDRRVGNEVCQSYTIAGQRPTQARVVLAFTLDTVNCGATQPFEFFLNGVSLGSRMSTAPCACGVASNIDTYSFDVDEASWNKGGANTIRFVNAAGFSTSAAVAYLNIQVTRPDSKTFTACLDADGIDQCTGVTACSSGPYATSPVDASTVIVDN